MQSTNAERRQTEIVTKLSNCFLGLKEPKKKQYHPNYLIEAYALASYEIGLRNKYGLDVRELVMQGYKTGFMMTDGELEVVGVLYDFLLKEGLLQGYSVLYTIYKNVKALLKK